MSKISVYVSIDYKTILKLFNGFNRNKFKRKIYKIIYILLKTYAHYYYIQNIIYDSILQYKQLFNNIPNFFVVYLHHISVSYGISED